MKPLSSILFGPALALAFIQPALVAEGPPQESGAAKKDDAYNEKFMKRAIGISKTAMNIPGSEPFGAVIVRNGEIVGEGLSHALASLDVTSHGEIEAIRDANRRLKRLDLSDCEVYTSCEPCPLCVAAIGIARLKKNVLRGHAGSMRQSFWGATAKRALRSQGRRVDRRRASRSGSA